MKSRIIALALMVSLLLVMAASAQARADKIKALAEVVLHDDISAGVFDVQIGNLSPQSAPSTFANPTTVRVFDNSLEDVSIASPYPSNITVSGLLGSVSKVTITLTSLNFGFPKDVDVLLVGPEGQSLILMSDAGDDGTGHIINKTLTFDDAAPSPLPFDHTVRSGTYKPTDFDSDTDFFPAPAPVGPYGATLSVFHGTNPNGKWSLYVVDDVYDDPFGELPEEITDGWSLTVTTQITPPPIPKITSASVAGKRLLVFGEDFDIGAVILLNGAEQKTITDDQNLRTTLIGKKTGKKIHTGDKLQVRNTNGTLSEEFTFIGSYTTIDFPGANISTAWAINSVGNIIGTYTYGDQHPQVGSSVDQPAYGFLLDTASFTSIELPGAFLTLPYAINDEGTIVGAYAEKTLDNKSGTSHAFQLSNGDFAFLDFPGAKSNSAWGINSAGDIVGVYLAANDTRHGFLLHKGQFTSIDYPGAILIWARGITPSGDIVGLYTAANGTGYGFLLHDAEFTSIEYPGAIFTNALGINARGDIVGRYDSADGKQHGYLLSRGHFTSIDFPGASRTVARGVNLRGEIVGEYTISSGGKAHAFLLSKRIF
jgi:uncharacterized membrane protein